MRKKLALNLAIFIVILLISSSCNKKLDYLQNESFKSSSSLPTIFVDKHFPTGVLKFESKESFKLFYENLRKDPQYVRKALPSFQSFRKDVENFYIKQQLAANSTSNPATKQVSTMNVPPESVGQEEYIYDLKDEALPVDNLGEVVNPDLNIIVGGNLYQFTRIGEFEVELDNIDNYVSFIGQNQASINFDPSYISVPGEVVISDNLYQVQDGIIRNANGIGEDILNTNKAIYLPEPVGGFFDPGMDSGGAPGVNQVPDYYCTTYGNASFKQKDNTFAVDFDSPRRRLELKTHNYALDILIFYFHEIDIKAKLQREKQFLWFTYWGTSFADELVTGFDNLKLETDYIFPHPVEFSQLNKPTFGGLADFQIGDQVLKTVHLDVNLNALGYCLNNSEIANFIDGKVNSLAGTVYNDLFKIMENKVLNSIDPTYINHFAENTKVINRIDDLNTLKWQLGKGERKQGYSHENTWVFDWNIGLKFTENGGVSGSFQSSDANYSYNSITGSFFARCRVGTNWHGIRMIVNP